MKFKAVTKHKFFHPALGAVLAVLCGLALWKMPAGKAWENASYDYLFRFGARGVTNEVVLIQMDNASYAELSQSRGQRWDRGLHAQLLNKLTDDGCRLVVFDVFFDGQGEPEQDAALAAAIRRHGRVALMAELSESKYPGMDIFRPALPLTDFLISPTNWGIAMTDAEPGQTARRHYPFPSPQARNPSLPWTAALLENAVLPSKPQEQWLRYYSGRGGWSSYSYYHALSNAPGAFRDKIVFIGNQPESSDSGKPEEDKFRTPDTVRNGEAVGGVEILATTFLNLMNGDWLRRPAWWIELLVLVAAGTLLGGGLCRVRPLVACALATSTALAVMLGAVSWSYYTNYWFPWLIIVGGQVPCALTWSLVSQWRRVAPGSIYEMAEEPFGKGAYGEVFLAQHKKSGEWFALKKVYRAKFNDSDPYEREYRGITRYVPVSSQHPNLLRVHYIGRDEREGYFFYVMDLGDSEVSGWEKNPTSYKPLDLESARARAEGKRLPARECVRIGLALAEALEFLHQNGLIHRDIKPSNVIFVRGQPKFADVGLVAEIPRQNEEGTWVGTPGYMPPPPEPPGTVPADIYGLGMVLFAISTGASPIHDFPKLSTTLVAQTSGADFMLLNAIISKACHPDVAQRYSSATELRAALREAHKGFEPGVATVV